MSGESNLSRKQEAGETPLHVKVFWVVFILIPLFTGFLHYRCLPNEHFDKEQHELLMSHEECDDVGRCYDHADEWRDKKTGEVFFAVDFEGHRRDEIVRITTIAFAYGLIGCFAFAYFGRHEGAFFTRLRKAVLLTAGAAGFVYAVTILDWVLEVPNP